MGNRFQRRVAIAQARKSKSWDWQELPIEAALASHALSHIKRAVRNDLWIVQIYAFVAEHIGPMQHLMIRSVEGAGNIVGHEPSWQDLQRIKNELCGPETEALQVYPRRSDVMDQVDMYHLFVLPGAWALPFGLHRECGFARG